MIGQLIWKSSTI